MVIPPGRERHTTRAMRTEASAQQDLAEKMTLASNTERTTCPGVRSTRRCQRRLYEHTRHPDSAVRSSNPQRTRPHLESRQQATVRMTFWGACSLPGTAQRSMRLASHGENPCDPDEHARRFAGGANRRLPALESR